MEHCSLWLIGSLSVRCLQGHTTHHSGEVGLGTVSNNKGLPGLAWEATGKKQQDGSVLPEYTDQHKKTESFNDLKWDTTTEPTKMKRKDHRSI